MVLYMITLFPLVKEPRDADPTLLYLFYTNDAAFYGSARKSVAQLKLLMDWRPDRGYFPDLAK